VIIPASNANDVALSKEKLRKIKIITVKTLADVLKYALKDCKRKKEIIKELQSGIRKVAANEEEERNREGQHGV